MLSLLLSGCTVNVYVTDPNDEIAQIVVGEEVADAHKTDHEEHAHGEEVQEVGWTLADSR